MLQSKVPVTASIDLVSNADYSARALRAPFYAESEAKSAKAMRVPMFYVRFEAAALLSQQPLPMLRLPSSPFVLPTSHSFCFCVSAPIRKLSLSCPTFYRGRF